MFLMLISRACRTTRLMKRCANSGIVFNSRDKKFTSKRALDYIPFVFFFEIIQNPRVVLTLKQQNCDFLTFHRDCFRERDSLRKRTYDNGRVRAIRSVMESLCPELFSTNNPIEMESWLLAAKRIALWPKS